jgi:hypothetical protein
MIMPGPLNYTTTIDPSKSATECMGMLAGAGARKISIDMESKIPVGLSFVIKTRWGDRAFDMPANIEGTYQALVRARRNGGIPPKYVTREQAARVTWRVLKDWLEVQIAMIEAGLADIEQIMLPYVLVEPGKTLYAVYGEQQPALEAGSS